MLMGPRSGERAGGAGKVHTEEILEESYTPSLFLSNVPT